MSKLEKIAQRILISSLIIKDESDFINCVAFDLIASFIVKDNHRFVTSKISGNSYQRDDAINYLINAFLITRN